MKGKATMLAYFERFVIELTREQAESGSHQGQCDDDIAALLLDPAIDAELARIPAADIADELREYGAWDDEELADHDANLSRVLWLACGNIIEEI
jgi:hypothetical protein